MKYVSIILILLLSACGFLSDESAIVGTWKGDNPIDGIMVFHKNGKYEIFKRDGSPIIEESSTLTATWEVVNEVEPHQLYITIEVDGKSERMPFGIYKIEGKKLILRQPNVYERTYGGFSVGISRVEMPKDFSGVLSVFTKI